MLARKIISQNYKFFGIIFTRDRLENIVRTRPHTNGD